MSPQSSVTDPEHLFALAEREALELRLAEKARDEKEYEKEEEEEEKQRQPDLKKDDMMARRTGAFQKGSGKMYNRFLPMPGCKKETHPDDSARKQSKSASRDPLTERNIKTKRYKMGQRWACMVWGMHRRKLSDLRLKSCHSFKANFF